MLALSSLCVSTTLLLLRPKELPSVVVACHLFCHYRLCHVVIVIEIIITNLSQTPLLPPLSATPFSVAVAATTAATMTLHRLTNISLYVIVVPLTTAQHPVDAKQ